MIVSRCRVAHGSDPISPGIPRLSPTLVQAPTRTFRQLSSAKSNWAGLFYYFPAHSLPFQAREGKRNASRRHHESRYQTPIPASSSDLTNSPVFVSVSETLISISPPPRSDGCMQMPQGTIPNHIFPLQISSFLHKFIVLYLLIICLSFPSIFRLIFTSREFVSGYVFDWVEKFVRNSQITCYCCNDLE